MYVCIWLHGSSQGDVYVWGFSTHVMHVAEVVISFSHPLCYFVSPLATSAAPISPEDRGSFKLEQTHTNSFQLNTHTHTKACTYTRTRTLLLTHILVHGTLTLAKKNGGLIFSATFPVGHSTLKPIPDKWRHPYSKGVLGEHFFTPLFLN